MKLFGKSQRPSYLLVSWINIIYIISLHRGSGSRAGAGSCCRVSRTRIGSSSNYQVPELIFASMDSNGRLTIDQEETVPWSAILPANLVPGNTASALSLNAALGWLGECDANHERCNLASKGRLFMPPRIIDVACFDSERSVRVVETTPSVAGKYLCLSHCWGTVSKPLQTTSSNIEEMKRGISLSSLPRTFRDAVDFVRRLNFKYLWIGEDRPFSAAIVGRS